MTRRILGIAILVVALGVPREARIQAQATERLSLQDRVLLASKIYRIVSTFFPHLSRERFDAQYAQYLSHILQSDDRQEFDLNSMAFIADLHDGHTWFYDEWLEQNFGQPVGFIAYPIDGKWVVVRSVIDMIKPGDVIAKIDNNTIENFYAANRKYVSASSDRDSGVSFFDTPAIFPERFTLTLDDGHQVTIDRAHEKKRPPEPEKTEGRWLRPGAVAYVKVPTFRGIDTQAQALQYFRDFHSAKAIILDVRANPGLGQPTAF